MATEVSGKGSTSGCGPRAIVCIIILFGIVSLCGDLLYEGARSANGQYLSLLGISAATLGLVYGAGEFLGYALRLVSGYISDRTGRQWTFIFIGYGMLVVVPMMGLTSTWQLAVMLILFERIGKGLRSPAKDTILSRTAEGGTMGTGTAFGIQEALDQLGAFSGPAVFALTLYISGGSGISDYQFGYIVLSAGLLLLLLALHTAYRTYKKEECAIGENSAKASPGNELTPIFWAYTLFAFLMTLGFVNFAIVGYHLKVNAVFSDSEIVLLYAMAMLADAGLALLLGKTYDRMKGRSGRKDGGIALLASVPVLTMLLPALCLSGIRWMVVAGMVSFGIVMAAHETIMRSTIADITPFRKRGTAYGIFYTVYGLAFLIGSTAMGILYDISGTGTIAILVVAIELLAMVSYASMRRKVSTA